MEVDNRRTTKTVTIVSGPDYSFFLRVNYAKFSKQVILDNMVKYNNPNKSNEEFIELWGEIWEIIINRQEIKEKIPNF